MKINKIKTRRVNEKEEPTLYKIKTKKGEYVLKMYNYEEGFKNSVNAFNNINEDYIPNIISINHDTKSILMNYYQNEKLNFYKEEKFKNFISSWFEITKNIKNKDFDVNRDYNHQEFVKNFEESTINSLMDSYSYYSEKVESICNNLRNYENINLAHSHLDPHLGNYIYDKDNNIIKVLDWEFFTYSPCAYEISKLFVKILIPLDNIVDFDVIKIAKNNNNLEYNEDLFREWIKVYQIRSTAKLKNRGPVEQEINKMYKENDKNYLESMEKTSKDLLKNKNII